jgi:uncharacterized protein YjbI with pentapeptide repeats
VAAEPRPRPAGNGEELSDAELRGRWAGPDGEELVDEVFARLLAGAPLDALDLGSHEGLIDLRGVPAPEPQRLKRFELAGLFVEERGNLLRFRDRDLTGLDFSAATLQSVRFFGCSIDECVFDRAMCNDWRLWACDVSNSSFVEARLRYAMLGAWYEERGDTYLHVDFSKADMRDLVCSAATFTECDFSSANLRKAEFEGTRFRRCRFRGELREVIFSRDDPDGRELDAERVLEQVDFAEAELREVEFRKLDLDSVTFPTSADHLVLPNYPCVLRRARRAVKRDSRPEALDLLAVIEHELEWLGPNQQTGVLNRRDLVEGSEEAKIEVAVDVLRAAAAACAESAKRSGPLGAIQRFLRRRANR